MTKLHDIVVCFVRCESHLIFSTGQPNFSLSRNVLRVIGFETKGFPKDVTYPENKAVFPYLCWCLNLENKIRVDMGIGGLQI